MAEYGIDSYHIAVGAGDGAIHILIRNPDTPNPEIVKAILVDAGDHASWRKHDEESYRKSIVFNINATIDTICSKYGKKDLQFDAIVVTHWDSDHYGGLHELIKGEIQRQLAGTTPTSGGSSTIQLRFMRYDAGGEPQTILYAPYWDPPGGTSPSSKFRSPPAWWFKNDAGKYLTYTYEWGARKSKQHHDYNKICLLKYDDPATKPPQSILGTNFLENQPLPPAVKPAEIESPKILFEKNPPSDTKRPGIYCVGVNQIGFPPPSTSGSVGAAASEEKKAWTGGQKEIVDMPDDSDTNLASIFAMVIWDNGHVSHYFAGDADFRMERQVQKWSGTNGDFTKLGGSITTIKLSHHGGRKSTPVPVLKDYLPMNVIVSCGKKHGHPVWEIVAYLDALLLSTDGAMKRNPKPLYSTTYPTWLQKSPKTGKWLKSINVSPTAITTSSASNKDKPWRDFKLAIEELIGKITTGSGTGSPSLFAWYDSQNPKPTNAEIKDKIAAVMKTVWSQLSNTMPENLSVATMPAWSVPAVAGVSSLKYIRYFRVQCRPFQHPQEGGVWIQRADLANEIDPPTPPALPAPTIKASTSATYSAGSTIDLGPKSSDDRKGVDGVVSSPPDGSASPSSGGGSSSSSKTNEKSIIRNEHVSAVKPLSPQNPSNTPNDTYCIYGSKFESTKVNPQPGKDVVVLDDKDSDLNVFINSLHTKVIGLTAAPSATGATSFDQQDEWFSWLKDSINATDLTCTAAAPKSNDDVPPIDGFIMTIASPLDTASKNTGSSAAASSKSPPLKFNTALAESSLGLSDPHLPKAESDDGTSIAGFLKKTRMLAFGLDPSSFASAPAPQTLKMTLPQAFNYVGLTKMTSSTPLMKILGFLQLELDPNLNGGQDTRNAVWFDPSESYKTTVRLQFSIASGERDKLNTLLQKVLGTDFSLDEDSVTVITKRSSTWRLSAEGALVQLEGELIMVATWTYKNVTFELAIDLKESQVGIEIKTTHGDALDAILSWLSTISSATGFEDTIGWLKKADSAASPNLRRVMIILGLGNDGEAPKLLGFHLDVEVALHYGASNKTTNAFLVTFDWKREGDAKNWLLKGVLWSENPKAADEKLFFPAYEKYMEFAPTTTPPLSSSLNLVTLFGGQNTISDKPPVFPEEILAPYIMLTNTDISFGGILVCQDPSTIPGNDGRPTLNLGTLDLAASYNWGDSSIMFSCDVKLLLEPANGTEEPYNLPAILQGSVEYTRDPQAGSSWTLNANLQDLYLSALYNFFDSDAHSGGVMSYLQHIEVKYLKLNYQYTSDGNDTFLFDGQILIGPFALSMTYSYESKSSWKFHAELDPNFASGSKSTVGEMITEILGSDVAADLPEFIADISIGSKDSLSFTCEKSDKKGKTEGDTSNNADSDNSSFIYAGSLVIDIFQLSFTQYKSSTAKTPKRIIKASITGMPASFNFPVVGELTKPFDEVYYLWVEDKSDINGLLQADVDAINEQLATVKDKILVKELSKKKSPQPSSNTPVIVAGSHFVLVIKEDGKEKVVIDYAFGQSKAKPQSDPKAVARVSAKEGGSGDSGAGKSGSGSSMAAFKKTIGPLTISNVGFQLQGKTLSILFDATFALGPLSFTLMGFGLGLEFTAGTNLQHLPKIVPSLKGLAVGFNRPPIEIAGLFEHRQTDYGELYLGGVIIGFTPYLFEAAGFYGKMAFDKVQADKKPTACIFGLLAGPLVELEFAEISGITGGFGYNSAVRYPSVSEILDFPFVLMKAAPPDPMQALIDMIESPHSWFTPADNSFWVAAGLKVTAFETLVIDAVVVVEWSPAVQLGIFGVAAADVPADPSIKEKFARVELGIAATVDFGKGIMRFEAQLMPTSFVLSPQCHLTGGFALYYWFEGSDPSMEGDWVFTIGGFNKAFNRPSQYPNPPRLGIKWNLDDSLSITGEAYFAITPKMCMGGGRLNASLSCGPLSAFFDAYTDFLINYKPFHFMADAGVSVGVRFTMDVWFVTVHISVEIGAKLYIKGPPVSGTVHVDFWVFGFDINFGPGAQRPGPVSLDDFYKLVYQAGVQGLTGSSFVQLFAEGTSNSISAASEANTSENADDHIISCVSGRIPQNDGSKTPSDDEPWLVRAGTLSFQIACRIPIDTAVINEHESVPEAENRIYAKPMQLTHRLTSKMEITISSVPPPPETNVWRISPIMKQLPAALWGKYDSNQDPSNPSAGDINSLLASGGPAINLMAGVTITTPLAIAATEKIIPFNVVKESMDEIKGPFDFPDIVEQDDSWLPLPSTNDEKQWDDVKTAWNNHSKDAEAIVDEWVSLFGWADAKLKGTAPPELLRDFGNYYVDAPFLSKQKV